MTDITLITYTFDEFSVISGFLASLADEESACNVGDLGSMPGWGRSPAEGYMSRYEGQLRNVN